MSTAHRIGLIVPSSNVTMETELPELFARQTAATGDRFTFHSARMRMTSVTAEAHPRRRLAAELPRTVSVSAGYCRLRR